MSLSAQARAENKFGELEEGNEAGHAQKIVKELYLKYEKQQQRWRDYRSLFLFLTFVAWFLATLYLERRADVAYEVFSTMDDVLSPGTDTMQSTDEIYAWVSNTLTVSTVLESCFNPVY
jgi:heme A synthase